MAVASQQGEEPQCVTTVVMRQYACLVTSLKAAGSLADTLATCGAVLKKPRAPLPCVRLCLDTLRAGCEQLARDTPLHGTTVGVLERVVGALTDRDLLVPLDPGGVQVALEVVDALLRAYRPEHVCRGPEGMWPLVQTLLLGALTRLGSRWVGAGAVLDSLLRWVTACVQPGTVSVELVAVLVRCMVAWGTPAPVAAAAKRVLCRVVTVAGAGSEAQDQAQAPGPDRVLGPVPDPDKAPNWMAVVRVLGQALHTAVGQVPGDLEEDPKPALVTLTHVALVLHLVLLTAARGRPPGMPPWNPVGVAAAVGTCVEAIEPWAGTHTGGAAFAALVAVWSVATADVQATAVDATVLAQWCATVCVRGVHPTWVREVVTAVVALSHRPEGLAAVLRIGTHLAAAAAATVHSDTLRDQDLGKDLWRLLHAATGQVGTLDCDLEECAHSLCVALALETVVGWRPEAPAHHLAGLHQASWRCIKALLRRPGSAAWVPRVCACVAAFLGPGVCPEGLRVAGAVVGAVAHTTAAAGLALPQLRPGVEAHGDLVAGVVSVATQVAAVWADTPLQAATLNLGKALARGVHALVSTAAAAGPVPMLADAAVRVVAAGLRWPWLPAGAWGAVANLVAVVALWAVVPDPVVAGWVTALGAATFGRGEETRAAHALARVVVATKLMRAAGELAATALCAKAKFLQPDLDHPGMCAEVWVAWTVAAAVVPHHPGLPKLAAAAGAVKGVLQRHPVCGLDVTAPLSV